MTGIFAISICTKSFAIASVTGAPPINTFACGAAFLNSLIIPFICIIVVVIIAEIATISEPVRNCSSTNRSKARRVQGHKLQNRLFLASFSQCFPNIMHITLHYPKELYRELLPPRFYQRFQYVQPHIQCIRTHQEFRTKYSISHKLSNFLHPTKVLQKWLLRISPLAKPSSTAALTSSSLNSTTPLANRSKNTSLFRAYQ